MELLFCFCRLFVGCCCCRGCRCCLAAGRWLFLCFVLGFRVLFFPRLVVLFVCGCCCSSLVVCPLLPLRCWLCRWRCVVFFLVFFRCCSFVAVVGRRFFCCFSCGCFVVACCCCRLLWLLPCCCRRLLLLLCEWTESLLGFGCFCCYGC